MEVAQEIRFQFERHEFDNGLVLLCVENQRLPLISLSAFVLAGSDQNPGDRPGTAALTSRMLDEGTKKYNAHELAGLIEGVGGSLASFSNRELSGISLLLRAEDLPLGMELLHEMLACPVFPEERLRLERERVLNRLQAMEDDPQIVAAHRLNQCIYQGTSLQYPVLGTIEGVGRLQTKELSEFHGQNYRPRNTILVAVGAADAKEVLAQLEPFSQWPDGGGRFRSPLPLSRQNEPILDEYFMEKEQVNIFVGHLGVARTNPDYHALQVMDVILGSGPGFTSRIPKKLRDEQGLAYSAYAEIAGSSGIHPGRFVAFVSTSPENRRKALESLVREIEQLVTKGVSGEELKTAQDFLTGSFVFEFQSNPSIARFLFTTELFNLGADYPVRYSEIIRSIDCDEVRRVAALYLDTINYTTVVVGPINERQGRAEEA